MEQIGKEFPFLEKCTYANTAAAGLVYQGLTAWRQQHNLDVLNGVSYASDQMKNYISGARAAVGDFMGCKNENVALVQNFSLGLNLLLEGLDKRKRILLLENDYPSVNWPFEDRGFPITYASIDAHVEENIWEKLKEGNISVLALSLVQWLDGIKIDLDFLKKVKSTYPDLLIIADGTQFCGTQNFNFEASAIDVLGASAYKWLLSGYGNGFMLFKDHVQTHFSVKAIGFSAANANKEMRSSIRFAKRFEPGHLDTFNFGSLKFSLEFLKSFGIDRIAAQNKLLSQKAKKVFADLGLLDEDIAQRKEHSTIFNIKGDEALFQSLTDEKVICAQRGDGIRLSFHFYNAETDID
ncbi:MAG: aminotransferase class V-fold PLP-dependent enzyme, partial [Flavobacteriaceae bacterium]